MEPSWTEPPVQPSGAQCAQHPTRTARTVCSRCGSYACRQCQRVGEDGLEYCALCVSKLDFLAERSDRFWANLVDTFVLGLPMLAAMVLVLLASSGGSADWAMGLALLIAVGGTLAVSAYQLVLISQSGQSLGKRMRNIRVVRSDGSPVSLGRLLFLRNVIPSAINTACGLFNLVDILFIFQDNRRCLHDMIADTKVVKTHAGPR